MENSISKITQLWDKALRKIEKELNDKISYDSFFSNSFINEIQNDGTVVVVTESKLGASLLSNRYFDTIVSAINDVSEEKHRVKIVFKGDLAKEIAQRETTQQSEKKTIYFPDAKLDSKLNFDNFVVGDFNREAYEASSLIAANPGKMFNPLFIYSSSGLGKTHLLHAIGNHITKKVNPKAKILYISANDFVEEYIRYVRGEKESESLKSYVSGFDVLLLDDVQFLANKVNTEEMFFFVYQRMINDGKQIVITSDRQPSELRNLEDRLVTRFSQGLIVKIEEPDQNTCVEILKNKIISSGYDPEIFDDSVIYFFADKFSKNVRELEGALNRLIFYSLTLKHSSRVTMDLAAEAASSLIGGKAISSQLSEQKIINCVADYYNLTPSQLTGKVRTGQIALARHIAMYLIRESMDIPLKRIGDSFGGKDHTTVMSGISKVDKELKTNEQLKAAVIQLRKKIKS